MATKAAKKTAATLPPVLPDLSKLASATVNSNNQKTGVMTVTNVTQASCPNGDNSSYKCPLLGNGCYAESGPQGMFVTDKLNKAVGFKPKDPVATDVVTPELAAQAEAEALERVYPKWQKTEWWPSGQVGVGPKLHQPLRLHVVGDCVTQKSASIVAKAADKFSQPLSNGGNSAYGYTHGWRDYPRSAWGRLSVLASCDTVNDIKSAQSKGWGTAAVIQRYAFSKVKNNFGGAVRLTNGVLLIPCPFEAERQLQHFQEKQGIPPEVKKHWNVEGVKDAEWIKARRLKDVQCVNCQLCMRDDFLRKQNACIGFAAHGTGVKEVEKLINIEPYLPKGTKMNPAPKGAAADFDWSQRDTDTSYADVIERWIKFEREGGASRRNPSLSQAAGYGTGRLLGAAARKHEQILDAKFAKLPPPLPHVQEALDAFMAAVASSPFEASVKRGVITVIAPDNIKQKFKVTEAGVKAAKNYIDRMTRYYQQQNPSIFSKAKSYLRGKTQAMRRLKAQDSPLTKDKKIAARIEGYAMQPKGAKRNPRYAAVPIKPSEIRQLVRDYPRMDVAMLWDEYVNPLIRSGKVEWDDPNGISPPIPPVFATLVFSERRNMGVRGYDKLEDFLKDLDPKAKAIMRYHARKSNPHQEASEMYRKFHGKASETILEIPEREHVHKHLAQLGTLTEVIVKLKRGGRVKMKSNEHDDSKAVHLCSSEDGTTLYFVGGDQSIDVKKLGFSGEDMKDLMVIGELYEITYRTQKNFDKFKTLDYFHGLGEVTKSRPVLLYKPRDKKMLIAGGQYKVKPEGIVN